MLNPRNVAAESMAEIDRGWMQGQLRGGRPKLKLVTVASAAVATVAADRHVHRKRATTPRRGLMQGTTSIPLYPRSTHGLKPKQTQDPLHRDLSANSIEVDTWHGCSSAVQGTTRCSQTVPFPLNSLWGTGTALHRRSSQALPTSGRATNLAGGNSARGVLARVMHQQHRQVELPLQRTKVRQ